MKIYNTLTRKKEEFVPIEPNKVKMYVCGPTVYDYIHIGNARPYIVFDTVRRYFEYSGYDVNYVQNFTDVDDKIINKANAEGVEMDIISNRYIEEVFKDADGLNVKRATKHPRVTEEMDEIIEMIKTLVDKNKAYEKNGTVYFKTRDDKDYGKLSKKNIDELESGARVSVNIEKEDELDFVLWKPHKDGEPYWESPFGKGRPGWHIECSVMAKKYLGETIDIHAGGEDLIFPHHENEIAQSEAANDSTFANYWMHNGFINVNNEKMSKSLGNFFTIREISEEFHYDVIRFFILSGHYRSPINFSRDLMLSSKNALDRIKNSIDNLKYLEENNKIDSLSENEKKLIVEFKGFRTNFENAMNDDFNIADAISIIFEFVKFSNINTNDNSSKEFLSELKLFLVELCDILGILKDNNNIEIDECEILSLIENRTEAKKAKNFALADEIREALMNKGIVIEDTRQGVKWSYRGR